jgi:EmrB/QacA subfamily drug resistance transporter
MQPSEKQHDPTQSYAANPWPAMWALVLGFFMIMVDASILNVANPSIMETFGADYAGVIWVTSSYLLAYAVPLMVTGRLGDRFGQKRIYLAGLVVFTLASLACGMATSLPALVATRAVQGFGASMMTPQTMAVITRLFPPQRRGVAMGLWGATAGVAMLVGPPLGGILVDTLSWRWIFFVNIPIGFIAMALVLRFVPLLEKHEHRFDLLGVLLSTVGLFLVVFGLQEGNSLAWSATVWALIGAGLVVLLLFLAWQARNPGEPLLPLELLADRNFTLASIAVALVGFAVQCFPLPLIFYLQEVRGLSPTLSGVLLMPSALMSAALARPVGLRIDRTDARTVAMQGLVLSAIAIAGYALIVGRDISVWWLLVPNTLLGIGQSAVWAPLSTTATRNLPPHRAGAGSGVYNTNRQVGSVLGSASAAALIAWRAGVHADAGQAGVAQAMSDSLWLPVAAFAAAAFVAVLFVPRAKLEADA